MALIQKNSILPFRNRYIPALLLIALFTSFAYINVEQIINSIEKDAHIINDSGRQRMLSQNLILLGLEYLNNSTEKNKTILKKNIQLMKTTHKGLITNHNSDNLDKIYTEKKLSILLNDFLVKFNLFIKNPTEKKITKLSYDAQVLLPLLSEVVKEYENINILKVEHLHKKQLIILITTIILLLLEIIFVFYPASKEIKNRTEQLKKFNNNLEKKVKEEVEKKKKKEKYLIQQSRLAQVGEMISMIAHQWRQPLSAISSLNLTIELQATLNTLEKDQTIKYTTKISALIQHLSKTIDDFREFFKQNKTKENFSSDTLLKSTIIIIENSLKINNINLIQDLNCNCNFKTYTSELKQVILNLLKNAQDALVDNAVKDPYIKISTFTKDGEYTMEISDNAGGIPKENIDKIFNPYFSTKIQKDGTGLGLYMSKTIIEEHCRGTLNVLNGEDGAIFKIILPMEE